LSLLSNIQSKENLGLNLIYSQFRTLEGIGIFILVLEYNGYAHFKIKKNSAGIWEMNIKEEDAGKPMFALFTGTEDEKERDILRSIYNGEWYNGDVPENIVTELTKISKNNDFGEIIKILMITSSGAEGINLRNTRYVHIMEPYWHPVRIEQVIGRARRICSHKDLPEEFQNVKVYLYLMTFSQEQIDSDTSIELKLYDMGNNSRPISSDEYLYGVSVKKEIFGGQIIKAIKESSIDCNTYSKTNSKEKLKCLSFSNIDKTEFSYHPNISLDETDETMKKNVEVIEWTGRPFLFNGIDYILRKGTNEVYDLQSYKDGNPLLLGVIEKDSRGEPKFVRL
jgi:hypothetical protein